MKPIVLLTGGLGYLGGRIARKLIDSNRFSLRIGSKRFPDAHFPSWMLKQDFFSLDMLSEQNMRDACNGVSYVVHLAALNELECAKRPDMALLVNSHGTMLLKEIAEYSGVKRFIYLSTAHVYAAPLEGYINEQTIPRPHHPYAISKLAGEHFVLAGDRMESVVLRMSNGFGCPVHTKINRWGLAVNDFCRQAVVERRIALKSNGLNYRDFVAFRDVENAILHFLEVPTTQMQAGIFNLGGARAMTILAMAELVAARCEILFGFLPAITVQQVDEKRNYVTLEYDITKIRNTGFEISASIEPEIDALLLFCMEKFGHE